MTAKTQASSPRRGGHLVAALIAVGLSVALHCGAAVFVSHIDIVPGKDVANIRRARKVYEAFKVREAPPPSERVQDRVMEELRRSGVAGPESLDRAVDELVPDPDVAQTEPPAASEQGLAAIDSSTVEPGALPIRSEWIPMQEILAIEDLAVAEEVPGFERQLIPIVERVENASPIAGGSGELSGDMIASLATPVSGGDGHIYTPAPIPDALPPVPPPSGLGEPPEPKMDEVAPGSTDELFQEAPEEVTPNKPIEQMLTYRVETYSNLRDFRHGYFRLEIDRVGEQILPRMPKDIILVQDCSASLAEQRLYFCRRGLKASLPFIGSEDRFNVAYFKETLTTCFPQWVDPTQAHLAAAETFIDGMQSGGNTDIYTSLRALLDMKRRPGRPMVAIVITDGLANKGYTRSSEIISQFSKANNGDISVFTVGTFKLANTYLVDLFSYCNRGDVTIVRSGRWDIPEAIQSVVRSTARPVLGNLHLNVSAGTPCDLYPSQPTNLYLDRPLVLYGRYPKGQKQVVLQAVGQAGKLTCDTFFDIALDDETKGKDKTIKQTWARQKIYDLMGRYARTGDPELIRELRDTSHQYDESVPYREVFGQ